MENTNYFVKKTCSFARTVVRKTQELLETSQVNIKIMQTKSKIEKQFAKMGCCLYNKQKDKGIDEVKSCLESDNFKNVCEKIDGLYDELKSLREEYKNIKKSYENPDDGDCCRGCGEDYDYYGESKGKKCCNNRLNAAESSSNKESSDKSIYSESDEDQDKDSNEEEKSSFSSAASSWSASYKKNNDDLDKASNPFNQKDIYGKDSLN